MLSDEAARSSRTERLRAAVAQAPASAEARVRLGLALLRQQAVGEAIAELEKAVELDPQYAAAWVNLGGARLTRLDFVGCIEANRRAAACDPDLTLAPYNEGLAHLYLGQARQMTTCFERVLELEPNHAGGHYYLAVGLLALGRTNEAAVSLRRAVALGHSPQPDFLRAMERALAEAQDGPDVNRQDIVKPKQVLEE